jgi:hypothetical protein
MDDATPTSTAPTTTTDDLEADLSAAFDKAESGEEVAETGKPDVSEAARTLASARKGAEKTTEAVEVAKGADTTVGAKGADTQVAAAGTDTIIEAPQHWPAADREMFGKQTPEAKQFLLGRHKAMEADYTRKMQELAPAKRLKETVDEVLTPFRAQMSREGIDDAAGVRQLAGIALYLQEKPQEALHWLAAKYGIDLKAPGGAEAGQPDPVVAQLKQTVSQLESRLNSTLSAQHQEQHKALLTQVEQFAQEKDAQGNLLRTHFDEVAGDIALLVDGAKRNGGSMSLQDAYDRAVYANPTTRIKVLAAQEAQRKVKEAEERAAKANAAKKAGFDVKGTGAAAAVVAHTDSIEAALEANYEKAIGRV